MYSWSSMAARYKVAVSGKMRPPFFKYLSRANKTVSSIDSYRRKYPIHSEMMISNSCRGSSESSSFPFTRVIAWKMSKTSYSKWAWSLTIFEAIGLNDLLGLINNIGHVDLKLMRIQSKVKIKMIPTPTTCFAPAFAANMLNIPVPHPTSNTVFPSNRWALFTMADR